jgi:hypothetical protein
MDPAARSALMGDVAVSGDRLAIVGCLHVLAGCRATEHEGLHEGKIARTHARANDSGQEPTGNTALTSNLDSGFSADKMPQGRQPPYAIAHDL